MADALIGHTGFIGGNLARQRAFAAWFRSTDIHTLGGRSFRRIVCAGAPAVKWKANQEPAADRANLQRLFDALGACDADELVLISTVDVFASPRGVTESDDPHGPNHAYGTHRLALEDFVRDRFPRVLVARLPGVFGPGLKKNVLFDLRANHRTGFIDPASVFQWYDVTRLSGDLDRALAAGLELVHLAPEPVPTAQILARYFSRTAVAAPSDQPLRYDLQTGHAAVFGGDGPYIEDAATSLDRIGAWLESE